MALERKGGGRLRKRRRMGRGGRPSGHGHPPSRGYGLLARLLAVLAVLLIAAAVADMRMRPMVEDMLAYQAKVYAFRTINDAMLRELEQDTVAYDDIARLTRTADGSVASIQTDVVAVNRLKSQMTDSVVRRLEDVENQTIRIPVGTLLGNQFTTGRGPAVAIRVVPVGYVQSELYNQFSSAGINQTLHQIMLQTSVQMVAVLPGYSVKTETSTSFCIAETVIVGAIPEGYTIVDGDNNSTVAKVNDYGMQK